MYFIFTKEGFDIILKKYENLLKKYSICLYYWSYDDAKISFVIYEFYS